MHLTGYFLLPAADAVLLFLAYAAAFVVRMRFETPLAGWACALASGIVTVLLQTGVLTVLQLNRGYRWRVALEDIPRYAAAFLISGGLMLATRSVFTTPGTAWLRTPYSVTLIDAFFGFAVLVIFRILRERRWANRYSEERMLFGARAPAETAWLAGKTVVVTGAGGTIGSEIVRQCVKARAATVLMVERSENALYHVDLDVKGAGVPVLADVTDRTRLEALFAQYRPDVLFHAAAFKHVPMCEKNPEAAWRNNAQATEDLVRMARAAGIGTFVFISTDKAVHPVSVMGQTKRAAEKAVLAAGYTAVRFGNVFGSSGSVVERWREEIARGGPVTVTDRRMTRYFMSVEEAVGLVLTAAQLEGGAIYTLDMGKPHGILALAEWMIRAAGYRPYADIPITFTGIRPGEKLEEELGLAHADTVKTPYAKIFRTGGGDDA